MINHSKNINRISIKKEEFSMCSVVMNVIIFIVCTYTLGADNTVLFIILISGEIKNESPTFTISV